MKKSLFFSFLGFIIVLTTTILIILYANGYTYDVNSQKIVETGSIKITSTPSGANISINAIDRGSSPLSIFNLDPATYTVTVKKDGYITWTSKVNVTAGNIVLLQPILYPSNIKANIIENATDIENFYTGKDSYTFLAQDSNHNNILEYHTFGSGFLNLGSTTLEILNINSLNLPSGYSISKVLISPNDSRTLVKFSGKGLADKYFFVTNDGSETSLDLDSLINTSLYQNILWGQDDTHLLLYNQKLAVYLDINSGQKVLLAQEDSNHQILNLSVEENSIIYTDQDISNKSGQFNLYTDTFDGTKNTLVLSQTNPISSLITDGVNSYAYSTNEGIKIFSPTLSQNQQAISSQTQLTPLFFSNDSKYLIYTNHQNNIFSYSIETNTSSNLGINMSNISSIIWDKTTNILLYTVKNPQINGYYSIYGINNDGSNNDLIFQGLIDNSSILVSPVSDSIIFEMSNIDKDGQVSKNIYQISIPGI